MNKSLFLSLLLVTQICHAQKVNSKNTGVQSAYSQLFSQFGNVRDFALSPTGNELYFTVQSFQSEFSAIVYVNKLKGKWSKPQIAQFSGKYQDLEPFFSPDGLQMYFVSNRPLSINSDSIKDFDIWYVQRNELNQYWSEPINLGSPVNTSYNEFYPSVSSSGNLYFTSDGVGTQGLDDIFVSKFEEGKYTFPVSLSDSINSSGYEFNAYISPNEQLLVFTAYNRTDGLGSGDLYYSIRQPEGSWSTARNLGPLVNSESMDYCPYIDFQNNILYFTSRRSKVPSYFKTKQSLNELLKIFSDYENGQSRIYKTALPNYLRGAK